jgi:hypothetical protein
MVTDDIARRYRTLSAEDRRRFDRWLNANAAVSLIIAGGLVAMALAAANSAGPRDATLANNRNVSDLVASEKRQEPSGVWARQKVEVHEKKF